MGDIFADDGFECIFMNENISVSNKISRKFTPVGLINDKSTLVQVMAWGQAGDKPLNEPMTVHFETNG